MGVALALLSQPGFGVFTHCLEEVPMQSAHGDIAFLRQLCSGPARLVRQFRPVLDVVQTGVHRVRVEGWGLRVESFTFRSTGFNNVIVFAQ